MELCDKIKEIRSKFGLTQEGLAEKLNVSRQAVAKWEMGNGVPDTENLKTMSRLFGISIDTLLDNESDVIDTLTWGFSSITNVISAFKTFNYLAVKENYKLFISISKKSIDIKSLNPNTNIKKFNLDNKTYFNLGEFKR